MSPPLGRATIITMLSTCSAADGSSFQPVQRPYTNDYCIKELARLEYRPQDCAV